MKPSVPLLAAAFLLPAAPPALGIELGLPARCSLGVDCFFQQFADMEPGPEAKDPFCGPATYDGHSGTDLRVLSMKDVARKVPVVAMADGVVTRTRDGEPDRLVATEADRRAVAGRECGNGLVLAHAEGYETQYCHLREGSIAVKPGEAVRRGDRLGDVGASGLAQFPHVHVSVRRHGEEIDPVTGRPLDGGCAGTDPTKGLFEPAVAAGIGGEAALVAFGLAGGAVDHGALSREGPPPTADARASALVGWAWFINMRQGDRIRIRVAGPDGRQIADQTGEPADRAKASFAAYAGKRGAPSPGSYTVSVGLMRSGTAVVERSAPFEVR